jgi:hypothetical protein
MNYLIIVGFVLLVFVLINRFLIRIHKGFIVYRKISSNGFGWYSHIRIKDKNFDDMRAIGNPVMGESGACFADFDTFKEAIEYLKHRDEKGGKFRDGNRRTLLY